MNEQISFSGWAYITRADDVVGCWVAHCLEFNIMSAGDSPQHALEMVQEAVGLALADDLSHGLDPRSRKADDEDWAPLNRLFEKHTKVPVASMDTRGQDFREFAAPLTVVVTKQVHDGVPGLNIHGSEVLAAA